MKVRIATFNLENLDDVEGDSPSLAVRIPVLRPQLERLRANVLCLQEVHGQEQPDQPRHLLALQTLLQMTLSLHIMPLCRHIRTVFFLHNIPNGM